MVVPASYRHAGGKYHVGDTHPSVTRALRQRPHLRTLKRKNKGAHKVRIGPKHYLDKKSVETVKMILNRNHRNEPLPWRKVRRPQKSRRGRG